MTIRMIPTRAGLMMECTECLTKGQIEEMSYGHDCEVKNEARV